MNINEGFFNKVKKGVEKGGEGAWEAVKEPVMNEINNAKKFVENKILGQIKNFFVSGPINQIPHKGTRKFFKANVDTDKDLGTVIKQLCIAIIKAILTILVLIPLLTIFFMYLIPSMMSLVISGISSFITLITSPISI
jgi:hypothetical protein